MPTNYKVACTCYVISALLDAFDGHAARLFNQSKITKGVKMSLVRLVLYIKSISINFLFLIIK